MRFDLVRAVGVGFLEDRTLELAPGLNVVHGPNEAGKSTWHAALLAGWLGLRRGRGAQRADDRAFHDRYRPWSGAALVAEVEVVTDDGRRLRFRHNLTDLADHEVTDGANQIVTGHYEQDGTADGAKLLGLTREMATATLCVSQAELLRVLEGADGLHEQLQRAAASAGSGRGTAANAIERLERFRREAVGTDRVTAVRPLRRAMDALADARAALRAASTAHEDALALRRERDVVTSRLGSLEQRRAALARGIQAADVAGQRAHVERLERLARAAAATGERLPAEEELVVDVRDALGRYTRRPPVPDEGPDPAALRAELAALPVEPDGDREAAPEVGAAYRDYDEARHRLRLHEEDADEADPDAHLLAADPALLDEVAAILERPLPGPDPDLERRIAELEAGRGDVGAARRRWVPVAAGAALALVGAVALLAGATTPGAVALVAAAVLAALGLRAHPRAAEPAGAAELASLRARRQAQGDERRRLEAEREIALERLRARGVAGDTDAPVAAPAELRALASRAREARRAQERRTQARARRQELHQAVERAAGRLHLALDARGVDPDEDVEHRHASYLRACRARAEQARRAARRADLTSRLESAERLAEASGRQAAERQAAAEALVAAAASVGFEGRDADAAAVFADDWLRGEQVAREQAAAAQRAATQLEAALGTGSSLADLQARLRAAEEAVGAAVPVDDPAAARHELDELAREAAELRSRADQLDGRLDAADGAATPVTEAEELVALREEELDRVKRLDATLRTTVELLGEAQTRVQQDLAPILRDGVLQVLPSLTGGRYDDVQVVPATLEVRVRTAAGAYRSATQLSHGTAEQVYLALRLVLADYLVTTGEIAPLVLDDVTVQFDEDRTVACLELLRDAAAGRQIVLFSQEREVASWARSHLHGPRDRFQELPPVTAEPTDLPGG